MPRVNKLHKKRTLDVGPGDILFLMFGHDFFNESQWPDPPDAAALASMRSAWRDAGVRAKVHERMLERGDTRTPWAAEKFGD